MTPAPKVLAVLFVAAGAFLWGWQFISTPNYVTRATVEVRGVEAPETVATMRTLVTSPTWAARVLGQLDRKAATPAAITQLAGSVRVTPVGGTRLVAIEVQSWDGVRAAALANAFAREYVRYDGRGEREDAEASLQRIAAERAARAEAITRASGQLGATAPGSTSVTTLRTVADGLAARLTAMRAERMSAEASWRRFEGARSPLDPLPVAGDPLIVALRAEVVRLEQLRDEILLRYGTRHPSLNGLESDLVAQRTRLDEAAQQIARNARADFEGARDAERGMEAQLTRVLQDLAAAARAAAATAGVEEALGNERDMDALLAAQERRLREQLASAGGLARLVESATPPAAPVAPGRALPLALLGAGCVCAVTASRRVQRRASVVMRQAAYPAERRAVFRRRVDALSAANPDLALHQVGREHRAAAIGDRRLHVHDRRAVLRPR